MKDKLDVLVVKSNQDYELIDSGQEEKLERFGKIVLSRPDPQALWDKHVPENVWNKADGRFVHESRASEKGGGWSLGKEVPARWPISLCGLKFWIKPTPFKHVGIFPEQMPNWEWLESKIGNNLEILNLFGYTGGATLVCAKAGANVVHVDSSKSAVSWAKENVELSGIADKPIRWIVDDARAFVQREIKRKRKYHGIIMDPPAYGHGPENELWKIEEHFIALIDDCIKLLDDKPIFFLLNGYSAGYSSITYANNLSILEQKFGGKIEMGELAITESSPSPRLLPAGIFARWSQ